MVRNNRTRYDKKFYNVYCASCYFFYSFIFTSNLPVVSIRDIGQTINNFETYYAGSLLMSTMLISMCIQLHCRDKCQYYYLNYVNWWLFSGCYFSHNNVDMMPLLCCNNGFIFKTCWLFHDDSFNMSIIRGDAHNKINNNIEWIHFSSPGRHLMRLHFISTGRRGRVWW